MVSVSIRYGEAAEACGMLITGVSLKCNVRPEDLPGDGDSRRLKRTNPVILNELWGEGALRGDTYIFFFPVIYLRFIIRWLVNRNVELIPGYLDRMRRECESEMIRCERVDVPAGFRPSYVRAESRRRHETLWLCWISPWHLCISLKPCCVSLSSFSISLFWFFIRLFYVTICGCFCISVLSFCIFCSSFVSLFFQ